MSWMLASFDAQVIVAVVLLACKLPRRTQAGPVAVIGAVTLACVLASVIYSSIVGLIPSKDAANLLLCTMLLLASAAGVWLTCSVGPLPALFCASAGYTIQAISSGLAEMSIGLELIEDTILWRCASCAVCYVLYWLVYVQGIDGDELAGLDSPWMLAMAAIVAFGVIGVDIVQKDVAETLEVAYACMLRVAHILTCLFVLFAEYQILYVGRLRAQEAAMEHMLVERKNQYRVARDNIDAINIKCHDIRHQIRQIGERSGVADEGFIESLEHAVSVYDAATHTGNDALDTIITEKGLACESQGVELDCMVDGTAVDFVAPSTLYSLFGNALDNAIEAAAEIGDEDRRVVSVVVRRSHGMASIHVENPTVRVASFDHNGLPITHKHNKSRHGFGMRSMQRIAEKYGGIMRCSSQDGTFYLDVMLPRPTAA